MELIYTMIRRRINMAYLWETKWLEANLEKLKNTVIDYGS